MVAAARMLARQQSVITTSQAASVGIGRERCQSLVRQGFWQHLDHGVYGPAGVPLTWHRRLMVALLIAPDGTLASHRAAAALLGVGGLISPPPEITIPRGTTLRRPWLVVHESTDLELADRCRIDGIPATGPRRLAMDLGSVISPKRYRQTIRELRSQHGVDFHSLLRTYLRHKRQGRNGGAALRDWLDRYVDTRYRIDLAFPDRMIAVEVDGAHHEKKPTKADDRRRDAALQSLGWTVIHVKASSFATDLASALRTVLAASVVSRSVHG